MIFSTVDTVGIPLLLLNRAGRVRPPLVYVAIGLPERLAQLGSERMRRLYARSLASSAAVLTYSEAEAEALRAWLESLGESAAIAFVPFGVDETAFAPSTRPPGVDVVSIGADPHRDVELLLAVASEMPTRSFRVVTTGDRARGLGPVPANVEVETDLPFDEMRRRLDEARVVALPVRENSYSGATTVLLQAMATAKPVVVSRTRAIATGYGLVDGENCRLVEPGDAHAFERALGDVLRDEWHARALGARARRTVEDGLTWTRYVDRIESALRAHLQHRGMRALHALEADRLDVAASAAASRGRPRGHRSPRLPCRPVDLRALPRSARRAGRSAVRRVRTERDWRGSRDGRADFALFHEFEPPPSGGGHQFLRALVGELERRGLVVEGDRISGQTPACLFNSFNFDFVRLQRFARADCRMVHRVDGPIGVYRGFDDGTDARIAAVNAELADATILQSRYSLDKHAELGIVLRDPVVISNTVDPSIFHPPSARAPLGGRPLRVIASSWSQNPRKGADALEWLDRELDPATVEITFVGQTGQRFRRISHVSPVDSHGVAALLRGHDVYLAASRDDPCSNALLEALACGLPAAFLDSGGHPELVGDAGLPFRSPEELPDVFERLAADLDGFRARISVPALADVADAYVGVLGLTDGGRP